MSLGKIEQLSELFQKSARKHANYWAGFLFYCPDDDTLFLIKRSGIMNHPYSWDLPGGRADSEDDDVADTGKRELLEEVGTFPEGAKFVSQHTLQRKKKDFYIYLYTLSKEVKERWLPKIKLNRESVSFSWFPLDRLPKTRFDLSWAISEMKKSHPSEESAKEPEMETEAAFSLGLIKIAAEIMKPRFEKKFIVPTSLIPQIKDFIAPYTQADEHGQFYRLKNIYLDNKDYELYKDHIHEKNRFKLRIRMYDNDDKVFLEIKSKINGNIIKHRSVVPNHMYPEVVEKEDSNDLDFVKIARNISAKPVVVIDYDREAFNANDGGRITFDRNVVYDKADSFDRDQVGKIEVLSPKVAVLELKYNGQMPKFMNELKDRFDLKPVSMSKYFESITDMLF